MQVYISAIQEGFIYGLLALGIYISLKILDIPDLTTEGSFGFGAAVAAVVSLKGLTYLSFLGAFCAGAIAGIVTALLQIKIKVHPVLAGIITMSALYSINLLVRGEPNLDFSNYTLFNDLTNSLDLRGTQKKVVFMVVSAAICIVILALVIVFFKTHLGLCIRATGDNPEMVKASSINVNFSLIFGLALSNGLIALSGALMAHYQGFSDQTGSNGTLIYGLAAVIIGEAIFGKPNVTLGLISAVFGSIIYKIIVAFVVKASLFGDKSASLMKLACALIVTITLIVPEIKNQIANSKVKREAKRNA